MLLAPRHFVAFIDGRSTSVATIAFLDGDLGRHIGALSTDVLIGREYARKIMLKHHLRYGHFHLIQSIVEYGYVVKDRSGTLTFAYIDDEIYQSMFKLVLKTADGGREVWVRTFHRIRSPDLRSLLRRGHLIREHYQNE